MLNFEKRLVSILGYFSFEDFFLFSSTNQKKKIKIKKNLQPLISLVQKLLFHFDTFGKMSMLVFFHRIIKNDIDEIQFYSLHQLFPVLCKAHKSIFFFNFVFFLEQLFGITDQDDSNEFLFFSSFFLLSNLHVFCTAIKFIRMKFLLNFSLRFIKLEKRFYQAKKNSPAFHSNRKVHFLEKTSSRKKKYIIRHNVLHTFLQSE